MDGGGGRSRDPFVQSASAHLDAEAYEPLRVDRKTLAALKSSEVFVVNHGAGQKQYYRNMLPELALHMQATCAHACAYVSQARERWCVHAIAHSDMPCLVICIPESEARASK